MDDRRSVESLRGNVCPGPGPRHTKEAMQSLCKECYFRLPKEMRNALYRRIYRGYAQALTQAIGWLASNPSPEQKDDAAKKLFPDQAA